MSILCIFFPRMKQAVRGVIMFAVLGFGLHQLVRCVHLFTLYDFDSSWLYLASFVLQAVLRLAAVCLLFVWLFTLRAGRAAAQSAPAGED